MTTKGWIKVEKHTPEKPQVLAMEELCQAPEGAVFYACVLLWTWMDEKTATGHVPGLTPAEVDAIGELPGFGAALEKVGWAVFTDAGMTMVNWDRHNGTQAKLRALRSRNRERRDKERQAALRNKRPEGGPAAKPRAEAPAAAGGTAGSDRQSAISLARRHESTRDESDR